MIRNDRRIGIVLIVLGTVIYVLSGIALERGATGGMADFKAVYFAARCLVLHTNPYRQSEFQRIFLADGGAFASKGPQNEALEKAVTICINLPTSLFVITPFALLPWSAAHVLWTMLTTLSYFVAALLIWNVAAEFAPILAGVLIGFVLATSQVLFAGGNTAGIVVSLCLITVWCFAQQRYSIAGILCLSTALLLKPHDAGPIWLFFLLAGSAQRKRALQAAALVVALGLPATLWTSAAAPQWPRELRTNIRAVSARGEINDPGPAANTFRSAAMVVDLQSAIAVFRDDPEFYNSVSYGICGALGIVWLFATLRSSASVADPWLGLVPILALTLLVTYHHPYDARLLLASVPAAVMRWKKGGAIGIAALLSCTAALVVNADIPIALLKMATGNVPTDMFGRFEMILIARPQPLALLLLTVVFLAMYVQQSWKLRRSGEPTPPPAPTNT